MEHYLPYLFYLACPISMGLMMWMMMKKDGSHTQAPKPDPRIAELESQMNELRIAVHQPHDDLSAPADAPAATAGKG